MTAVVVPPVKTENNNLILICGSSKAGKSTSLKDLVDPTGVLYLNTEANKKLPFNDQFRKLTITDPATVYTAFNQAETKLKNCHSIIVDSLTFLLEMYVSQHVVGAQDGQAGWMNFQQYFKTLMQSYVAKSTKNVIFTAHVESVLNEQMMVMETKVPVQGALKKNGIEAYFSTIVSAKTLPLEALTAYENPLLTITEEEELVGVKHVFQTKLTKETVNERISSSVGMWSIKETYIDNNTQFLLDRLHTYYGTSATTTP
jgi:predicted transcriptional regulator